jgi:hypothetical protein
MYLDLRIKFLNFFRVLPLGKVFAVEEALQIWYPYAVFLVPFQNIRNYVAQSV